MYVYVHVYASGTELLGLVKNVRPTSMACGYACAVDIVVVARANRDGAKVKVAVQNMPKPTLI